MNFWYNKAMMDLIRQNWVGFLVILVGAIILLLFGVIFKKGGRAKVVYKYCAKPMMTEREEKVFRRLVRVFDRKFFVIPQVHLGSILDHKIKGQNWNGAFQHINRKSVDYVLLNKETLKLVCVVELDDSTHKLQQRRERDREVERIFQQVAVPLVRINDLDGRDDGEIIELFAKVINGSSKE